MSKPNRLTLTETATATTLNLTASDDKGRRRFEMAAYTGAPVKTAFGGVIIDIDGMDFAGKRKPILREHDRGRIAGYADSITVENGSVMMRGFLSKTTADGKEIAELADEGFPWQASVGIDIDEIESVTAKDTITVNGLEFSGPGMVIRKSTLKESSFVPLGADANTTAAVFSDGDSITSILQEKLLMATENKPDTAADAIADAEDAGFKRGYEQAKNEISSMFAAFPTNVGFAWQSFNAGKSVEAAKAEFNDIRAKELDAKAAELATKEAELAKVPTVTSATAVGVSLAATETATPQVNPNDPKSVAAAEWDADEKVRVGFSSKDRYVAYRSAVLTGRIVEITAKSNK
jgi:hypothetical protein